MSFSLTLVSPNQGDIPFPLLSITALPSAETLLLPLLLPKPSEGVLQGEELAHIARVDIVTFPWRYMGKERNIGQKSEPG